MNSSPEELENGAGAAAAAAKAKRKDLMGDIKSRLNLGYNMKTYGKKNEKELETKVKFFEKKIADGRFKEFMRPRMEEAKTLLARVQALRATPLAAKAAVPVPEEPLRSKAVPAFKAPAAAPAATGRVKTQKNKSMREKAKAKPLAAAAAAMGPAVVVPPPVPAAAAVPVKSRKVRKVATASAFAAPPAPALLPARLSTVVEGEGEGEEENENGLGATAALAAVKRAPREEIENEFLYEASQKYLPLPQFYDPYTGRRIPPEESPLTPIERAYKQLKKIRRAAYRNAATLRAAAGRNSRRSTRRRGRRMSHA
jgi:hypothetical protein